MREEEFGKRTNLGRRVCSQTGSGRARFVVAGSRCVRGGITLCRILFRVLLGGERPGSGVGEV